MAELRGCKNIENQRHAEQSWQHSGHRQRILGKVYTTFHGWSVSRVLFRLGGFRVCPGAASPVLFLLGGFLVRSGGVV